MPSPSPSSLYGTGKCRVTLYSGVGLAFERYTLQSVDKSGLDLTFTPEGVDHPLGSGNYFKKDWSSLGLRAAVTLVWATSLVTTLKETWNGSVWVSVGLVDTIAAVARIEELGFRQPCLVEPHLDKSFNFLAQPDLAQKLVITDLKGTFHRNLALKLISTLLVTPPATW